MGFLEKEKKIEKKIKGQRQAHEKQKDNMVSRGPYFVQIRLPYKSYNIIQIDLPLPRACMPLC